MIKEVNGRWTCTRCGYEWSGMMADSDVPTDCPSCLHYPKTAVSIGASATYNLDELLDALIQNEDVVGRFMARLSDLPKSEFARDADREEFCRLMSLAWDIWNDSKPNRRPQ